MLDVLICSLGVRTRTRNLMFEVVLRSLGLQARTRDFMFDVVFVAAVEGLLLNLFGVTLFDVVVVIVVLKAVVVVIFLVGRTRRTA